MFEALFHGERAQWWVAAALVALLVVSALGVIYSSHQSRQLFNQLQELKRRELALEEQWGKLLLEQSTWSSHDRIRQLAETRLNMVMPEASDMEIVHSD